MKHRFILGFLAGALALLVAPAARATPDFPPLIVSHLNITCSDPIWDGQGCTICHVTNNGGLGTVQHPFGANLKAMGLVAFDETELTTLLDDEKTAMHDFNCDGTPDITELENCEWEKLATVDDCGQTSGDGGTTSGDGGGTSTPPAVVYGCSASSTQGGTLPASVAASLAGFLVVAVVRRRALKAKTPSR